jgi:hypothetical protein
MIEWNTKICNSKIWTLLLNDFETTNLGKVLQIKKFEKEFRILKLWITVM